MVDPYSILFLYTAAIGWSIVGIVMVTDIWSLPKCTWRWKFFLFPFVGPAAWGVLLYRGLHWGKHYILVRMELPTCGCCSHH